MGTSRVARLSMGPLTVDQNVLWRRRCRVGRFQIDGLVDGLKSRHFCMQLMESGKAYDNIGMVGFIAILR